jgi:hypothetical protein
VATSRSKVNSALRSLLSKRPGYMAALGTIDRLEEKMPFEGDDRGAILVSVALLEQVLEDAILVRCMSAFEKKPLRDTLFSGNPESSGAVNTLAGKIVLAHALGVFGPMAKEDLDRLRRIRNVAAHAKTKLTFESTAIKKAVSSFNLLSDGKLKSPRTKTSKGKFLAVVGISMIFLTHTTRKLRQRRSRPRLGPKNAFFYD